MKKIYVLLMACILLSSFTFAQGYPHFSVTAYDSLKSEGYYFFSPYVLSAYPSYPAGTQHHMILDKSGEVIYYRPVAGYFAGDFKLQANGQITYCANGKFYVMDSTLMVIDSVTTGNGVDFDIHDLQILSNGHYLILGNEDVTMDLSSYHIFLGNGSPGGSNATVRAFVVQELDSAKNIVFEWHSIDHFAFDDVDDYWLTDVNNVDWTHVNAVEMDNDSNLLISSRHFDEITKISRTDSSVIWRLGGKRNQFTFIGDSMMFLSQHDCRRIANGNLTLFDNGRATSPLHFASAKEYALDETNMTATLVWSHNEGDTAWSRSQGNAQRLSNGNTLISYGNLLPSPVVFNVVDSMQNKVFEIMFPDSQITYRSYNYPSIPWTLPRPQITCMLNGSQYYLSADSGYSDYLWSNGDTTQNLLLTDTGSYSVFVSLANGGYIRSEVFVVSDTADPCGIVKVALIAREGSIDVFPNPVNNTLHIRSEAGRSDSFQIYDMTGRMVRTGYLNQSGKGSVDLSGLPNGIYTIRSGINLKKFIKM